MYLKSGGKSFLNFYIFQVIPDYFAATVLQRSSPEYPQVCYNLESEKLDSLPNFQPAFGNLKFQVAFNLVVIWMIVFICLSKGWKTILMTQLTMISRRVAFLRQGCLCFWNSPHHRLRRICLQDSSSLSAGASFGLIAKT